MPLHPRPSHWCPNIPNPLLAPWALHPLPLPMPHDTPYTPCWPLMPPQPCQWECWDLGLRPNVVKLPVHLPSPNAPDTPTLPVSLQSPLYLLPAPDVPYTLISCCPWCPLHPCWPPMPPDTPYPHWPSELLTPASPQWTPDTPYTHASPLTPLLVPWHPLMTLHPAGPLTPLTPCWPLSLLQPLLAPKHPYYQNRNLWSVQYTVCSCQEFVCSTVKLSQFLQYLPKHALQSSSCFMILKDQQSGLDKEIWLAPVRSSTYKRPFAQKGNYLVFKIEFY